MFERITVKGRGAFVAYLDQSFNPVDKRSPALAMIKVLFDDGESLFIGIDGQPQFKD